MKNKIIKYILSLGLILVSTGYVLAQEISESGSNPRFIENMMENMVLTVGGLVILAALLSMVYLVNVLLQVQKIRLMDEQGVQAMEKAGLLKKESFWSKQYKKWTDVVPVEKEDDIMFDHEYDGIRELDNSLPPWWVAMFYITIAFAVIYFSYYHITGYGASSVETYEQEMVAAEEAVKAYLAKQADQVDETNVEVLEDELALSTGKTIYEANCLVCHGSQGEGGVGPNFADKYWIHGGSIKDLFKTIKYGVPEKGMISWKTQLKPADMQKVASYILTFQGTNPPNAKEPQGELYDPDMASGDIPVDADSTATEQDDKMIGMK